MSKAKEEANKSTQKQRDEQSKEAGCKKLVAKAMAEVNRKQINKRVQVSKVLLNGQPNEWLLANVVGRGSAPCPFTAFLSPSTLKPMTFACIIFAEYFRVQISKIENFPLDRYLMREVTRNEVERRLWPRIFVVKFR